MYKYFRNLPVLFLVLVFAFGCASPNPQKAASSETLKPSGIHEDCTEMSPGDICEYSFDSSKALNFNIHYHEGGAVLYSVQKDDTSHEAGRFEPQKKQYYCLMWTNPGSEPVTLTYSMKVEKK